VISTQKSTKAILQPIICAIPVQARHSSIMAFGSVKARGPVVGTSIDSRADYRQFSRA
jgi:hypothetical protein